MIKKLSIIAMVASMISFGGVIFAQEANKAPEKAIKNGELPKLTNIKNFCKPPLRMPYQVRNAFELFKYADELKLTDDQLIQLRAYYKKHFSEEAKKKEIPVLPTKADFYSMNEQELLKFVDDESARVKKDILNKLQKIIDIKKILTPEQIEKIKKEAEKEAERNLKRLEERLNKKPIPLTNSKPTKPNEDKKDKGFKHFKPHMYPPQWMMPHQHPMMPFMPPMCPQQGMMNPMGQMPPMPQMGPQQGMMNPMGCMPPMPQMCPQQGMMNPMGCMPPMPQMCPQQGMMNPMGHMPPMPQMCPQQGMMNPMGHMPPMGMKSPKCNDDKFCQNRCKRNVCKFKNPTPMKFRDKPKMEPPFASLLSKFFGCKKDCDSDIMKKDKKIEVDKNLPKPKK